MKNNIIYLFIIIKLKICIIYSFCDAGYLRQSYNVPERKEDSRASLSTQDDDVHRLLQTDTSHE